MTPISEDERLNVLQRLSILDTPPEGDLDELTRLASRICDTPIALVSLVDRARQFFKARVGLEVDEIPREGSFCSQAIQGNDLFVVQDAAQDPRFRHNSLVLGPPHVRFYAAMPLVMREGAAVGTLCVLDARPRELTPVQAEALQALGHQVVARLEARRLDEFREQLVAALDDRLRDRIGAIVSGLQFLMSSGSFSTVSLELLLELVRTARKSELDVDDLVELARESLGSPSEIVRRPADLHALCREVAAHLVGDHRRAPIELQLAADGRGSWDLERLRIAFRRLAGAVQDLGAHATAIRTRDVGDSVLIELEADAPAVDVDRFFAASGGDLALPLVRHAVLAHGGRVRARRSSSGRLMIEICLSRNRGV